MKVIKPNTASTLFKSLVTRKGSCAFISVLAGFRFGGAGLDALMDEGDMWSMASAWIGEQDILDLGVPKPSGEYMVYGACHAPQPVQALRVSAEVAGRVKTLQVMGDRRWVDGAPSAPTPFTSMALGWDRAYGGPNYDKNPLGRGRRPADESGGEEESLKDLAASDGDAAGGLRLPNILPEDVVIVSPGDEPPVAGFRQIPISWPQRTSLLGTHDENWLAERWPYFPQDIDLSFAYAAPEDQRFDRFFLGDEKASLENMHPGEPRQEFQLPGLRARVFLRRMVEGREIFNEPSARLDTLWLFPEQEAGIVLFRSICHVFDEELDDVSHCLIDFELLPSEPRPQSYYEQRILAAMQPEPHEAPPTAPLPPASPEATPTGCGVKLPSPETANLQQFVKELEAHVDKILAEQGLTQAEVERCVAPAEMDAWPKTIDELAERAMDRHGRPAPQAALQSFEAHVDRLQAEVQSVLAGQGLTMQDAERLLAEKQTAFQPGDVAALLKQLAAHPAMPEATKAELATHLADFESAMAGLSALSPIASAQAAAPEPHSPKISPPDPAGPKNAEEALALHAQGQSLAGFDMRGFDFADRDLCGADFRQANLDDAIFRGAQLEQADFSGAGLLGADFSKAALDASVLTEARAVNATFAKAVLRGAKLDLADFTSADLSDAVLQSASMQRALFESANMGAADLREAAGLQADFDKANLTNAMLTDANLPEADFSEAKMAGAKMARLRAKDVRFGGADCTGCDLHKARLPGARADKGTSFAQADLSGADMAGARFESTDLSAANLSASNLDHADLARTNCEGANFKGASMQGAEMHKANLQNADMCSVNLFQGSLRMADVRGAALRGSNLYGVDLYKSLLLHADLEGANLKRTLLTLEGLHGD
jgi:uncharacterized protein YjbI with pentapeptide repeats